MRDSDLGALYVFSATRTRRDTNSLRDSHLEALHFFSAARVWTALWDPEGLDLDLRLCTKPLSKRSPMGSRILLITLAVDGKYSAPTWVVDVIASFCFKRALLCVAVWLDTLKRRFFQNGSEHFNFFHPPPLNPLPPISMLSFRMEVARTSSRGRSKTKQH